MKTLRFGSLAFSLGLTLFVAQGSAASFYTYNVSESLPCSNCTGNISLQGTITTDGLGSLSGKDVVVWGLTMSLSNQPPILLTQNNSAFSTYGSPQIQGTASNLIITLNKNG
jgi:hypothetical protein